MAMMRVLEKSLSRVLRKEITHAARSMPLPLRQLLESESDRDALDRQQLVVTSLNDLRAGAHAELVDQTVGLTEGAKIRDRARGRRLHAWKSFINEFDEAKRDDVAAALAAFEKKEVERRAKLADAMEAWRDDLAAKDPDAPPKEEPWYTKMLNSQAGSPEKAVKKLMGAQIDNEGKLFKKLQRLGVDVGTDVNALLKGQLSALALATSLEVDGVAVAPPGEAVYVLDFRGDVRPSQVKAMKDEISAILTLPESRRPAELVLRLYSRGGSVYGYGLAEAELRRVKDAGIKLTVCVDEIAASGGYMMAAVADHIVASPWAILGSIGVMSGMPNAAERMEREGLKFYKLTAGEHKNHMDPFTAPNEADIAKTQEDMERILEMFAQHVEDNRGARLTKSMSDIATGDTWAGADALALGLVDALGTSEEYLADRMRGDDGAEVYHVKKLPDARSPLERILKPGGMEEGGGGVAASALVGSVFEEAVRAPDPAFAVRG